MTDLIDHYERALGTLDGGWSTDPDGREMPFTIARFPECRFGTAFATVGLSHHVLHSQENGAEIRQEMMMIVPDSLADSHVPALLQQVGEEAIRDHHALLGGMVLAPRGTLFKGSQLEALYVAAPAYFPPDFATCHEHEYDISIVWLIPISSAEARYVEAVGWNSFEKALTEQNPDLINVYRAELSLTV